MGLFDRLSKAIAALKRAPGVVDIKNYFEVEDLTSKCIMMKVVTKSSNLNIRKGPGTGVKEISILPHIRMYK